MYFPRSKSSYTLAGSTTIDIKKIEFTTKLNLFIMTYYSDVVPNGGEMRIRYTNIGPAYLVKKKNSKDYHLVLLLSRLFYYMADVSDTNVKIHETPRRFSVFNVCRVYTFGFEGSIRTVVYVTSGCKL